MKPVKLPYPISFQELLKLSVKQTKPAARGEKKEKVKVQTIHRKR